MPKPHDKCGTTMLPADDVDCEKARFICPECAPAFVLIRATTFTDETAPNDAWSDKYLDESEA